MVQHSKGTRITDVITFQPNELTSCPSLPTSVDVCCGIKHSDTTGALLMIDHEVKISIKEVKRGFRSPREPMVCGISFEHFPAWMWSLRSNEWSSILVSETDELRLRQSYSEVHRLYKTKLTIIDTCNPLSSEAVVWWSSGSLDFVNSLNPKPPGIPHVSWVTGSSRRLPPSTIDQWLSVFHWKVGGSTTVRGKFRVRGLDSPVVIAQDLTRNIGHIVKFSIRSKACTETLPNTPHYLLSLKLSLQQLDKIVLVPSNFFSTGWECRTLAPAELATAFELPDYVTWDPTFATQLIPLQILRTVMDSVLELQLPSTHLRAGSRKKRSPDAIPDHGQSLPGQGAWLLSLQRWLPDRWPDSAIADKAVKADDAAVNVDPWFRRISLVLPCSRPTFDCLTRLAMRRWRFNLIRSFFVYLAKQHGHNWIAKLSCSSRKRGFPGPTRSSVAPSGLSDSKGGIWCRFHIMNWWPI
jgi:hypothetical protein